VGAVRPKRRPEDRSSFLPAVTPMLVPIALVYVAAMALGQAVFGLLRLASPAWWGAVEERQA